ncbi:hypothetical protein Zm00014a_012727 [Zea mays]|jgi:hypothetical protein|uniref:Uncharacterized protein n=2 Tax=Zea mays TaxID=4577 RepID=A0A1D6G135_MAIZE|nr:hypothetical protein ZEAMMB73_Zm00001d011548 [Zea mays]PWZ11372.1 hypothetical protein Zm00014a_012727 [Zea mays]|eukprot:XP_020398773.1 uncharacterized protein LOC109941924 [Zea mays]
MASLRQNDSFVNLLDKKLHKLSTSKMRISKSAPDLLKKAVTSVKSKTDALRTKIIIVASLRRRLAMLHGMSRQIHGLTSANREKQARMEHSSKALTMHKAEAAAAATTVTKDPDGDHGGGAYRSLFEVAMLEEDYCHGYPDWINSLFDDDKYYNGEDDHDELHALDNPEEPSVIEIIRTNREVEGLEFNVEDDIDEACDMFIRRVRSQMNLQIF